jgi:hypothetical protein
MEQTKQGTKPKIINREMSQAQVERLKSALKVKTTEELVAKLRGVFVVNKPVNTNIDKK